MGDELGKFDVIESGGVLHHLDEPMRGWKRLYSLLDEGGLMRIGLYSRLARQSVTKIREELIGQETKFDLDWLREKRRQIIQSNSPHHVEMRSFRDFFSTSNVRDLIFQIRQVFPGSGAIKISILAKKIEYSKFLSLWDAIFDENINCHVKKEIVSLKTCV